MNIRFLPPAEQELDEAFAWYETQANGLGYRFLDEFDAALQRIQLYPDFHTAMTHGLRRCLLKQFPYAVIYGQATDIIIVAVAHQHRKPTYWDDRWS